MAEEILEEMEEDEGKSAFSVLSLLLIIIVLIGAYMFYRDNNSSSETTNETSNMDVQSNSDQDMDQTILAEEDVVFAQATAGEEFLTANATIQSPGYVIIYDNNEGTPGEVIGQSEYLSAGESGDIMVDVNKVLDEDEYIYAMLYSDDGDQVFDSVNDAPIMSKAGEPIMMMIIVASDDSELLDASF